MISESLIERSHRQAKAERWRVSKHTFAEALEASVARAFAGRTPDSKEAQRYVASLHLEDLALACACAEGDEQAWEHFVLTQRPVLYRAADVLDPTGGARDLADSLYGDLFGLQQRGGERRSLFQYFHGRSSLATWLRAVLAQRFVDRLRVTRREEVLPEDDSPKAIPDRARPVDPDRERYLGLIRQALEHAVSALPARDRLRLASYYAQELTLAETGRMLGEHEATASRNLARTRAEIRNDVERRLREEAGLTEEEVARCFECVTEDAGPLDLRDMLDTGPGGSARKESGSDRSIERKGP